MKKYIRANKYKSDSDKYLKWMALTARALADVIDAETEDELRYALVTQGKFIQNLPKEQAIDALVQQLSEMSKNYSSYSQKSKAYPSVQADLIGFLKSLGYSMDKVKGKLQWGDEGWVIIPADECEFKDLNIVCKQISDEFGNDWDTPLYGSWTGHSSEIDGVRFHVSFERDYDYDPSGKERSLMIYF